jgi:hypothetical protein
MNKYTDEDLHQTKYLIDTLARLEIISHKKWKEIVSEILYRHLLIERDEWRKFKEERNAS